MFGEKIREEEEEEKRKHRSALRALKNLPILIVAAATNKDFTVCSIHLSSCLLMQVLVVNGTFELNVVKNNPCEM